MRPASLRQWAKRLDIPFETFRRQMHAVNDMNEGKLIRVLHGKMTLTEAGLRHYCPEYFHDEQSNAERIDQLEKRVREQEWEIQQLTAAHKAFRKKAHEWFEKIGGRKLV